MPTSAPTATTPTSGFFGPNTAGTGLPSNIGATPSSDPTVNPGLYGIPSGDESIPVTGIIPPSIQTQITNQGQLPADPAGSGQTITLAQAIAMAQHFSRQDIIWLQEQLTSAGIIDSSLSSGKLQSGVMDANTTKGYISLLLQSFKDGVTSQQELINISQANQLGSPTKSIAGILSHGSNVSIDLTNPTDLNYAADKMYQSLLERNATPAEKAQLVHEIQSAQQSQGLSKQDAANAALQNQFNDAVNSRNNQLANQAQINSKGTTPTSGYGPDGKPVTTTSPSAANPDPTGALATVGAVPLPGGPQTPANTTTAAQPVNAGSISNQTQWATALAQAMGWATSASNINAIVAWELREGGHFNNTAHFNPLNTTQRAPGSSSMNSVNVQAYNSWQQGLTATVQTLHNGNYNDILAAFQTGNASTALAAAGKGLKTWSGAGYDGITGLLSQAQALVGKQGGISTNPNTGALDTTGANQSSTTIGDTVVGPDQFTPGTPDTTTSPASSQAQLYNDITTGPNRRDYLATSSTGVYSTMLNIIKSHGLSPTGSGG